MEPKYLATTIKKHRGTTIQTPHGYIRINLVDNAFNKFGKAIVTIKSDMEITSLRERKITDNPESNHE